MTEEEDGETMGIHAPPAACFFAMMVAPPSLVFQRTQCARAQVHLL